VAAENLHITLRFVGSVDRPLIETVASSIADLNPPGFQLALGGVGTFKRGRLSRVVWLGLTEGAEEASGLAALVDAACRAAGLPGEQRAFTPHLTLARARDRDGSPLPELSPAPQLDPWRADELVLYQSHLGRGGAVYEVMKAAALKRG
jgi:2'-5' RNA ligase